MSGPHPLDDVAPLALPQHWPLKRWAPIARDRVGQLGAVTDLQRSNARNFFAMTTVFVRQDGVWVDEFANGDLWPQPPTSARPDGGRPFATLTGVSGAAVGPARTNVAVLAGVVTTTATAVHVASASDEHRVAVDQRTGAFVALSVHASPAVAFRLVAVDAHGRELDRVEYLDAWSAGMAPP